MAGALHGLTIIEGHICRHFFDIPWWWLLMVYALSSFLGYITHLVGHFRFSGRWFRAHAIGHHVALYPPSRFLADRDLTSNDPNGKFYLPAMLLPLILTYVCFGNVAAAFVTFLLQSKWWFIADYFHSLYHLQGAWPEKYTAFKVFRDLHYRHHQKDMMQNFGVADFVFDCMFATFAV